MHNELIEQLKKLRVITPNPAFLARSRATVLAASPQRPRSRFAFLFVRLAGAIAVLAGMVSASSFLFPTKPVLSSSLNPESLREEIQNTLAIQVQEIRYEQQTNQAITSAIDEIRDANAEHLNPALIEKEIQGAALPDEATTTLQIDALLDTLTQ